MSAAGTGGLLDRRGGGRLVRGGLATLGGDRSAAWDADEDGAASSCFFLWVRQQSGHRHSMTKSPFSVRRRVNRHPNCELMSV
jgi:hypothetical protein